MAIFFDKGDDPESWLQSMEDYFDDFQISMDDEIKIAISFLRGAAATWAIENKLVISRNWCAFSYHLLWEFNPFTKVQDEEDKLDEPVIDEHVRNPEHALVVPVNSARQVFEKMPQPEVAAEHEEAAANIQCAGVLDGNLSTQKFVGRCFPVLIDVPYNSSLAVDMGIQDEMVVDGQDVVPNELMVAKGTCQNSRLPLSWIDYLCWLFEYCHWEEGVVISCRNIDIGKSDLTGSNEVSVIREVLIFQSADGSSFTICYPGHSYNQLPYCETLFRDMVVEQVLKFYGGEHKLILGGEVTMLIHRAVLYGVEHHSGPERETKRLSWDVSSVVEDGKGRSIFFQELVHVTKEDVPSLRVMCRHFFGRCLSIGYIHVCENVSVLPELLQHMGSGAGVVVQEGSLNYMKKYDTSRVQAVERLHSEVLVMQESSMVFPIMVACFQISYFLITWIRAMSASEYSCQYVRAQGEVLEENAICHMFANLILKATSRPWVELIYRYDGKRVTSVISLHKFSERFLLMLAIEKGHGCVYSECPSSYVKPLYRALQLLLMLYTTPTATLLVILWNATTTAAKSHMTRKFCVVSGTIRACTEERSSLTDVSFSAASSQHYSGKVGTSDDMTRVIANLKSAFRCKSKDSGQTRNVVSVAFLSGPHTYKHCYNDYAISLVGYTSGWYQVILNGGHKLGDGVVEVPPGSVSAKMPRNSAQPPSISRRGQREYLCLVSTVASRTWDQNYLQIIIATSLIIRVAYTYHSRLFLLPQRKLLSQRKYGQMKVNYSNHFAGSNINDLNGTEFLSLGMPVCLLRIPVATCIIVPQGENAPYIKEMVCDKSSIIYLTEIVVTSCILTGEPITCSTMVVFVSRREARIGGYNLGTWLWDPGVGTKDRFYGVVYAVYSIYPQYHGRTVEVSGEQFLAGQLYYPFSHSLWVLNSLLGFVMLALLVTVADISLLYGQDATGEDSYPKNSTNCYVSYNIQCPLVSLARMDSRVFEPAIRHQRAWQLLYLLLLCFEFLTDTSKFLMHLVIHLCGTLAEYIYVVEDITWGSSSSSVRSNIVVDSGVFRDEPGTDKVKGYYLKTYGIIQKFSFSWEASTVQLWEGYYHSSLSQDVVGYSPPPKDLTYWIIYAARVQRVFGEEWVQKCYIFSSQRQIDLIVNAVRLCKIDIDTLKTGSSRICTRHSGSSKITTHIFSPLQISNNTPFSQVTLVHYFDYSVVWNNISSSLWCFLCYEPGGACLLAFNAGSVQRVKQLGSLFLIGLSVGLRWHLNGRFVRKSVFLWICSLFLFGDSISVFCYAHGWTVQLQQTWKFNRDLRGFQYVFLHKLGISQQQLIHVGNAEPMRAVKEAIHGSELIVHCYLLNRSSIDSIIALWLFNRYISGHLSPFGGSRATTETLSYKLILYRLHMVVIDERSDCTRKEFHADTSSLRTRMFQRRGHCHVQSHDQRGSPYVKPA